MASGAGARGGKRALTGRRPDPIRNNFTQINKDSLGKVLELREYCCNSCMEKVSGRADRMKDHLEKCKAQSKVMIYLDSYDDLVDVEMASEDETD